jgi:DNA topoisomerase IB
LVRLRHVSRLEPGLSRRRCGSGFVYHDAGGRRVVASAVLGRIRGLAIPPAWTDVWICRDENGHLQAVGTDVAGRRQYLYHERWRRRRDAEKFDSMLAFSARLPRLRRAVDRLVREDELSRERVLAFAVGLLDHGLFRIGGEEYAEGNGTHGLTTLERADVELDGDGVLLFDYVGKGGKRHRQEVADAHLLQVGVELKRARRRDPRFLAYRNGRGWKTVSSDDVNSFLKELAGDQFSAKDFRTWHATVLAAIEIAAAGEPRSAAATKRAINDVLGTVAESLGNTPAVCRASYVDPRVFDAFRSGDTVAAALGRLNVRPDRPLSRSKQEAIERAVRRLIRAH